MNLLIYRYGSICEPDVIHALHELGHTVTEITLEIIDKNTPPSKTIQVVSEALFASHYDAIFSINYFPVLSELCNIFKLPYLSWSVDSPVFEFFSNTIRNPWNRVFLFDRIQYEEIAPSNPGCVFYLPLAANVARWDKIVQDSTDASRYTADISFVGSLYTEKCPYDNFIPDLPAYMRGYLNGLMEAQLRVYGYYFVEESLTDQLVSEFRSHVTHFYTPPESFQCTDKMILAQLYLGNKITALERTRLLGLLGKQHTVNIYTASDTSSLSLHNCGLAKTHTEMPLIFHHSRINLNMTAKGIRSGLPLRLFDILGCGGFALTNYQSELPEYFTIGEDLDAYANEDEFLEKCNYYLSHNKERQEIAHNGYLKVREHHTYTHRMQTMLDLAFAH